MRTETQGLAGEGRQIRAGQCFGIPHHEAALTRHPMLGLSHHITIAHRQMLNQHCGMLFVNRAAPCQ
ncbi:hypothetical protein [Actinopolyspora xinjiangensis]|uniref:hypothetical protein n=1 Tax=Actinopolyspora xinjiangensis TaxID=405564 RepID=UPI001113F3C0|nr:hypothetical protein [Actinopolyspora xinjiangensis]